MSESLDNYFPITLKSDLWEPKVMKCVHKIFLLFVFLYLTLRNTCVYSC